MPVQARYSARLGLVVLIGASMAALTGCGSLDGASSRIANIVKPYRVDVVQGNFVSREQVEALQPGMSRQQVRDILGPPLATSLFAAMRRMTALGKAVPRRPLGVRVHTQTSRRRGPDPQADRVLQG